MCLCSSQFSIKYTLVTQIPLEHPKMLKSNAIAPEYLVYADQTMWVKPLMCGFNTWKKHPGHSCEQHMKHFSMWACVIVVSSKIIKSQTSCFKSEQVVPGSKSAGMRFCFLFFFFFFPLLFLPNSSRPPPPPPPVCQLQSCIIISKVLLNPLLLNTRMSSAC